MEHRHHLPPAEPGVRLPGSVLDGYSRKVLAWRLSNTLETRFCLDCLDKALRAHRPLILNSGQGMQFTSTAFTGRLPGAGGHPDQHRWSGTDP